MSNKTESTPADVLIVEGTAIAEYGERVEVRELTDRMMAFHPAANDVGERGMLAVAQLAILTGANPLSTTGEVYPYMDKGKLKVVLGIAYWRRKAREVDTPCWYVGSAGEGKGQRNYEPRMMTGDERAEHGVQEGDRAAICKAYRMSEYLELLKAGINWQVAQQMIARVGIGIVTASEVSKRKGYHPTGRTWQWVANKRAEQDVYRGLSLITENTSISKRNARDKLDQLFTPAEKELPTIDADANELFFGK